MVQVISYSPPHDALWQIFLAEDFSKYAAVATVDRNKEKQAWLEDLKISSGLKWEEKTKQTGEMPSDDYGEY